MTPWTAAHQVPLSTVFSRQEYWSEFPFPSPEHLPNPGVEPGSPALQVDSLPSVLIGRSSTLFCAFFFFLHKDTIIISSFMFSLLMLDSQVQKISDRYQDLTPLLTLTLKEAGVYVVSFSGRKTPLVPK